MLATLRVGNWGWCPLLLDYRFDLVGRVPKTRSHTHKGDSVFWRTVIQASKGWRLGWHVLI
jgi:hypothetical protein